MTGKLGKVVKTADGSLSIEHPVHGQLYHSSEGALFEAQELYIERSGFKERVSGNISVLDVGLGLGYNAMVTLAEWRRRLGDGAGNLEISSLEINQDLVSALASGKASWQENWPDDWKASCKLLDQESNSLWRAEIKHPRTNGVCFWNVCICDAIEAELPTAKAGGWDFVWHDPFSSEKNPKMWGCDWFKKVRSACSSGSVLMTYSVSREVKDAIEQAGWKYEKTPTPGKKRSWLKARF